jgi:hypothetical protein
MAQRELFLGMRALHWSFLVLLLAGCAQPEPLPSATSAQQENGSISGLLLDSVYRPSVGANVTLVELQRVNITNAQGEFRFTEVPAGTYTLRFVPPHDATFERRLTLTPGQDRQISVMPDTKSDAGIA